MVWLNRTSAIDAYFARSTLNFSASQVDMQIGPSIRPESLVWTHSTVPAACHAPFSKVSGVTVEAIGLPASARWFSAVTERVFIHFVNVEFRVEIYKNI